MTNCPANFDAIISELSSAGLQPVITRKPQHTGPYQGVVADSRKLSETHVFCAIRGGSRDGHSFLENAPAGLSLAIIEDPAVEISHAPFGVVRVTSTRAAWAQLASYFAGHPSRKLLMIGITGTNGKTSTVWMIKSILDALKIPSATIGTLGFYIGETHRESRHTTPDPDVLYPLLAELVTRSITHVVMEISSHSLVQGKVWPIAFAAAAFTSFSQDHLDFHPTMDDYFAAKMTLFTRQLSTDGFALFHHSIAARPMAREFLCSTTGKGPLKSTYSIENRLTSPAPDFTVRSQSSYVSGFSRISVRASQDSNWISVMTPMVGDVFAENVSAALIIVSQMSGKSLPALETLLAKSPVTAVPGRLQLVTPLKSPWRPLVYIDYAHTPDALEKAILTLSQGTISVTTVFGCGGERDRSKRAIMGDIASRLSKEVFVTSDNPRSESAEAIVDEVFSGAITSTECHKIVDRRTAIQVALSKGGATKKILIAGKGHENYQIIGQTKHHFSDEEEALKCLTKPRRWLVFGAGRSGLAASAHLAHYGETVYLSDDREITLPESIGGSVTVINRSDIPWDLLSTVVISPGVPLDHEVPLAARKLGKDVITEIDLGFDRYRGNIIAVTGTNGKSTAVAMTEHIFRQLGLPAVACGNIGLPPTALFFREESSSHTAIVELSSYQLEGSLHWPSRAAAITSFSFDHLARHKTMKNYFAAKWRVTEWLTPSSLLVVMEDVARYASEVGAKWPDCRVVIIGSTSKDSSLPAGAQYRAVNNGVCELGGHFVDLNLLGVAGAHNHVNALMAALLGAEITGRDARSLLPLLASYRPLSYRCEVIFKSDSRIIVNDSKSTNLESTMSALSMATRPAVLLMGGQGKGESYLALADKRELLRLLVTFGSSRLAIKDDAPKGVPVESFEKMSDAVLHGLRVARDNKCDLIFSPGCASFDEFKNFEHRGTVFNELVLRFNSGGF